MKMRRWRRGRSPLSFGVVGWWFDDLDLLHPDAALREREPNQGSKSRGSHHPPRHVPKSSARIKERRPSPSRELELRRSSHFSVHLFSSERHFLSLVSHSVGGDLDLYNNRQRCLNSPVAISRPTPARSLRALRLPSEPWRAHLPPPSATSSSRAALAPTLSPRPLDPLRRSSSPCRTMVDRQQRS